MRETTSPPPSPSANPPFIPQITLYRNWLSETRGLSFDSYDALWRWSTTDLDAFWQSVWDYFELQSPTPHSAVLAERRMPGAQWFPGAQVNYAQQVFRHVEPAHAAGFAAILSRNEKGQHRELGWPELRRQVASLALHLKAQGVEPGDRVAAYLPNIPEAMVAFLAVVSLGGVWSICAPDMGTNAVLDRFKQIAPKVLIACDGVSYGGRDFDRSAVVAELQAALPSVQHVLLYRNLGGDQFATNLIADYADFTGATARNDQETAAFEPRWLPFDHPLWIVYSSGTTGLPKPIVHGHGGTVLVALALKTLHNDVGCSYEANSWGERYHWYSSTGWVMWNAQMSGLLNGTTCCIYDGNPGGSKDKPDWTTLWRFAADLGVTFFGAGAAFFANCMKAGIELSQCGDLTKVRALGTTGSPLSPEAQNWGTQQFRKLHAVRPEPFDELRTGSVEGSFDLAQDRLRQAQPEREDIWWCNISGGTDFAGAFIGGNRELPLVPGEMQCRLLGCAVEAWNEEGQPVINEVGELVCTQPIPSMPLYFWGDQGAMEPPGGGAAHPPRGSGTGSGRPSAEPGPRYLSSYFDMYPHVWRHGDWLKVTPSGGCIIYGRSDATINRHGLRMGTSELYSAIEALPEVLDSMVVDLEYLGRESYMPLFVVLRAGVALDDAMKARLNNAVKTALSPRFVPNDIFQVPEIPRTLSGKKQELPIKKLLLGQPLEKVVNQDAMANPACLAWYVQFSENYLSKLSKRAA
ncbi:acetoacetate--CoA ligase [Polaromonas sp.]|uniref:acetoacetate--CoA ligase n=1 Tax=Polaromonas sp. TaxID=1869339 RepID=UPI002FC65E4B